ncbi:DUF2252 family protein [Marinobacterium arenosum]|uniref:DUF2252 family protein n=1 Tax=Marinobacterium arenosum TaxID=2862496 RepID=UPI001C9597D4|nr:DUF2252 family protein [Marinobacterium arenosum]MBY4678431.1 DUF2252 domain-containing protein [Marinobacterium arenosum]
MKVLHTRARQLCDQIARANAHLPDEARRQKFEKMASSAFIFFRGTSHLFWHDMSRDWRISLFGGRPQSQIWLQGDAHLYNFGALHDHQDRIYYGMDDFDDAVVADYQFDLWRLAASLVLDLKERSYFSEELADRAVKQLGKHYLLAVAGSSEAQPAVRLEHAPKPIRQFLERVHRKSSRRRMLGKWTEPGLCRFNLQHAKLEAVDSDTRQALIEAIGHYQSTRAEPPAEPAKVLDIARRTQAGTGSLGSHRYYALIAGPQPDDNLILDIKQQHEPAPVAAMPALERDWYRETFSHEGRRHAQAYQAIAEHPDSWLGWLELDGAQYSVRERSPFKKDFPTDRLTSDQYLEMAAIWGEILGREHARGSQQVQEPGSGFIDFVHDQVQPERKAFLRLLRAVALNYARCCELDWQVFKRQFACVPAASAETCETP